MLRAAAAAVAASAVAVAYGAQPTCQPGVAPESNASEESLASKCETALKEAINSLRHEEVSEMYRIDFLISAFVERHI